LREKERKLLEDHFFVFVVLFVCDETMEMPGFI
jgi:hypothetical protein